ncbi:MAG: DUF3445 domain-containing protein [Actinomycetota bacterium]
MTADPTAYPIDVDRYRNGDHSWLDELDRLAVHAGAPHQRMGTRGIDPATWLQVDDHYDEEVALRRRLVASAGDAVYLARPDSHTAGREAALLVRDWLGRHHPHALSGWNEQPDDPLLAAGTVIQEDLCVMQKRGDHWYLTAGLVCFPTHWNLGEKFDRPQEAIHEPVPHYAEELASKVSMFFDRLGPERVVSRRNWAFAAHPLLYLPLRTDLATAAVDGPESIWFRSERQTLRRLVVSDAVLFTIKVQQAPVTALATRPDLCRRLLESLRSFSPEMTNARSSSKVWMAEIEGWLAQVIEGS